MQTCDLLSIDDVSIKTAEINKGSHGIYIPIRSKSRGIIMIQTPKMFTPFGASSFRKAETLAEGKFPRYDVRLSLDTNDAKIAKLLEYLTALDNLVCTTFAENKELLQFLNMKDKNKKTGKSKTVTEILEDLENNKYVSIVKPNDKYPALFKINIGRNAQTNVIDTFCQNGNEPVQLNDDNIDQIFHKAMRCKCVFVISHIWILSNRFGVTLKLKRVKLYPQNPITYAFVPDEDDEETTTNPNQMDENDEEAVGTNEPNDASEYDEYAENYNED